MGNFTETDMYLFGQGTHYDIYKKMGAHPATEKGKKGVRFTVWAPKAKDVSVIGDFNNWDSNANPMEKLGPQGVYEVFVPGVKLGALYKYSITTMQNKKIEKADPYACYAEMRPGTASAVAEINNFKWTDGKWMEKRKKTEDVQKLPMAIYEVHPGSWKRHPREGVEAYYNYRELAHALADYVKEMGFTHVELMGIAEYPFDGSWGYQVTGYYAPTSRHGTPADFAYMVNYLHKKNIGVILDWVPAHFPKDAQGLADFDGSPVYEYADTRKGEHPDWGTKVFDYGKNEVKNFLLGNALMWIEHYHVDGLRVDAVASMLYLDYGRKDGQWVANKYGGNGNLDAIEFFKHLNTLVLGRNKGTYMIAEESTAWPKITASAKDEGLNFSFKWNMGWMHDFLDYMKLDPIFRRDNHNKMTFAMSYNGSENYILVISHDEVVHMKGSMLEKMPGVPYPGDKFRNLMVGYAFMMGHSGKKLLFMGQEFAQAREWNEDRELDWGLLAEPDHQHVQTFLKDLLNIYNKYPCMYENDNNWKGFEWVDADDRDRSTFSFIRKSETGRKNLLFVCNFTPNTWEDFRIPVPKKKQYKLLINSADVRYGGEEAPEARPAIYKPEAVEYKGRDYSFAYPLPYYGVAVFTF